MSRLQTQRAIACLGGLLGRFTRDRSGNVAMIFGLVTMIVITLVGGAVDYGRWFNAKTQNQGALDAAVLAAGRALQTSGGNTAQAIDAGNTYYSKMKSLITVRDTSAFELTQDGTAVKGTSDAFVATPFLSLVGINELPIYIGAEAILAAGGNSESNLEVSLMLDVTGSMAGSKITDLKDAAKDLIDIVVWADQNEHTSKVAIAPFAPTVNVGDYFKAVTNEDPNGAPPTYSYPKSCYNKSGQLKKSCAGDSDYMVDPGYPPRARCVVERTGTYEYTEDAPAAGKWIPSWNAVTGSNSTTCTPGVSIVPLTADKTKLKATIDSFSASGMTAGAAGTVWAWYLISPTWSTIWPAESRPAPYSDLTTLGPNGQPRLMKIAVLMTDGEYNQHQGKSASATTVSNKAKSLCTNMKAKGILVYTVGFQLDTQLAKDTMLACATDASYAYNAGDGEELRQAFRDIALKIATLRINK
jgi:Flp pilus assembly protein TadG